jgi:hypothetical protein
MHGTAVSLLLLLLRRKVRKEDRAVISLVDVFRTSAVTDVAWERRED